MYKLLVVDTIVPFLPTCWSISLVVVGSSSPRISKSFATAWLCSR